MGHELRTEIEIDAPIEAVWAVLTDLDRYAEWNPFIVSAAGTVEVGARLTNRMQPPGGRGMTFRPRVTEVARGEVFEWLGHLGVSGLFDGRHRFALEATVRGTRLVHSESFRGVLAPLFRRSMNAQTLAGFEAMNVALKARAEELAAMSPPSPSANAPASAGA